MFPLAFIVVEQNNKDSWTWFMEVFNHDFGDPSELGLGSDFCRQKVG